MSVFKVFVIVMYPKQPIIIPRFFFKGNADYCCNASIVYLNAPLKQAGKQHKYKPAISVAICFIELDYSLQGSETSASSLMLPALNPVKEEKRKEKSAVSLCSDGCFSLIYQSRVLEPENTRATWRGDISGFSLVSYYYYSV